MRTVRARTEHAPLRIGFPLTLFLLVAFMLLPVVAAAAEPLAR